MCGGFAFRFIGIAFRVTWDFDSMRLHCFLALEETEG